MKKASLFTTRKTLYYPVTLPATRYSVRSDSYSRTSFQLFHQCAAVVHLSFSVVLKFPTVNLIINC